MYIVASYFVDDFMIDPAGSRLCHCPDPCVDSEYTTQISTYKYPNYNVYNSQHNGESRSCNLYLYPIYTNI